MDRKIRVAQIGAGKMSVYTMRYVYEKGAEIVAAIDVDLDRIGKDISEIMGGEPRGITIFSLEDAEKVLKDAKPDVAIPLYEYFKKLVSESVRHVGCGIFGADMKVSLLNDGPVTIVLDTDTLKKEK